jgi:hypothetical protein
MIEATARGQRGYRMVAVHLTSPPDVASRGGVHLTIQTML